MLQYEVDGVVFEGFSHFRPGQVIPDNPKVEIWLCIAYPEGEVHELYVVQVSELLDGFKSLGKYFRRIYGWTEVKTQIFPVSGSLFKIVSEQYLHATTKPE